MRGVRNPIFIGNRTEGKVLAALSDAGYQILLPFGSGCRYDLAFDDHGRIKRVQCKTGQLLKNRGAVFFRTAKQYPGGRFVPYTADADYFGVYCPETHEVYLVPVSDVPEGSANLRIDAPMNNQVKRIRWAKDYLIPAGSHGSPDNPSAGIGMPAG
jgi:PD-(D/E)XK endonuclease